MEKRRHFQIHRLDGSETDVSFLTAIDGKNHRRDRLEALRVAIEPQIVDFRRQCFDQGRRHVCPLRKVEVTPECHHIDHIPPATFMALVKRWLDAQGITLLDVAITPTTDNQIVSEMILPVQRSAWEDFHARHAQLRRTQSTGKPL